MLFSPRWGDDESNEFPLVGIEQGMQQFPDKPKFNAIPSKWAATDSPTQYHFIIEKREHEQLQVFFYINTDVKKEKDFTTFIQFAMHETLIVFFSSSSTYFR